MAYRTATSTLFSARYPHSPFLGLAPPAERVPPPPIGGCSSPPCLVFSLRGGADGDATSTPTTTTLFQLDTAAQESQHLSVLSSYGVVTVLILNCALRLYTSTKFDNNNLNKMNGKNNKKKLTTTGTHGVSVNLLHRIHEALPHLFAALSGLCVICSAFTGVMFQLLAIYSKSALGMGNVAGYRRFQTATAPFRKLGFQTFLLSFASFVGAFLIRFYHQTVLLRNYCFGPPLDDKKNDSIPPPSLLLFGGMVVLTVGGSLALKTVLNLATQHIFAVVPSS